MFKTKEEIKRWLDKYEITDYTINDDLTVDVDQYVGLSSKNLTETPVQFNKINGSFYCENNQLTSLKDSPKEVNGSFYCENNSLTSLKHLPEISGELFCDEYLYDTREYKVWLIGKQLREMV